MMRGEGFTPTGGVMMVNKYLEDLGFSNHDADPTDWSNPAHPDLRFKTGCAMAEVTTQIVRKGLPMVPVRATTWAGIDKMMLEIAGQVDGVRR